MYKRFISLLAVSFWVLNGNCDEIKVSEVVTPKPEGQVVKETSDEKKSSLEENHVVAEPKSSLQKEDLKVAVETLEEQPNNSVVEVPVLEDRSTKEGIATEKSEPSSPPSSNSDYAMGCSKKAPDEPVKSQPVPSKEVEPVCTDSQAPACAPCENSPKTTVRPRLKRYTRSKRCTDWSFNPNNPKGCSNMVKGGTILSADFLYWGSQNHGFSYAYEVKPTSPAGLNSGKILRLDSEWSSAFRLGIGWNINYDFWDALLNYTWYNNQVSETKFSSDGFYRLFPISNDEIYSVASASSHFKMNMGDLEFGRLMKMTKSISLRPHLGFKGGTLYQKFHSSFDQAQTSPYSSYTFRGKNQYWGIGPRLGLDTNMYMLKGFGFLGKFAGALLYGGTDVSSLSKGVLVGSDSYVLDRKVVDSFSQLVPTIQFAVGLQWSTCLWCEKMFFKTSLSWEANYFWNQFNLPTSQDGIIPSFPSTGNQPLSMEGISVNFELDF